MPSNLIGPKGQFYADPKPTPDEVSFRVDNTSSQYYSSPYYLQHKNQVQRIPQARDTNPLALADFVCTDIMGAINKAGKIVFHSVGDTGAAKVSRTQTAADAIKQEARVADAMVADIVKGGVHGPAFFFHLGDVIYNFGEAQYYYDQFYEPFREYDRPIFAIPGNHDGMVFGPGSSAPQVPTLDAFLTNFCAAAPGPSPDAGGLVRSVMNQPGVYFVLDAPFVSIIGLYSNVLDGPGVISSQGGHYPISDDQLGFLKSQLARLKPAHDKLQRAVILATHHPPLSADAKHGGSTGLVKDLDSCCKAAGLWPDMVLSGHAHLYQRFTRVVNNGQETPYIVSGSGGFAATRPKDMPTSAPIKSGDQTLEIDPIVDFGYLTLETDGRTVTATFQTSDASGVRVRDSVTVDVKSGKIVNPAAPGASGGGATPVKKKGRRVKR